MSEDSAKYLKALLALQVLSYEAGDTPVKTELLLARAGLSHREIADLLGKSYDAVAQTVSRAGRRTAKGV
jgi:DNA-directed RNA polymerase specialized sigma24 family protein